MKKRGHSCLKAGSRRPMKTNKSQRKKIMVTQKRDPFISARELKEELKIRCTNQTICNVLLKAGLRSSKGFHFRKKQEEMSLMGVKTSLLD